MTRADDRRGTPQPVECARCGGCVEIVKFSPQHTSAQWTAAAVRQCAEFRALAAEGTRSALVDGCAAQRDSVDAAVASGRLAVSPPTFEQSSMHEPAPTSQQAEPSARLLPGARGGGDPGDE